LGGIGALFGRLSPPKPPRGDGTGHSTKMYKRFRITSHEFVKRKLRPLCCP